MNKSINYLIVGYLLRRYTVYLVSPAVDIIGILRQIFFLELYTVYIMVISIEYGFENQ